MDDILKKKLAIKTIKNKIESFISSGIYNDLDEFIKDNPDLKTFQEKTKLNNSLRRIWGYQITDEDYQTLIIELKIELEEKLRIQKENLTTVQANGKEITTFDTGSGHIIVDNSYSEKSIDDQLHQLQDKYSRFRQEDTPTIENNNTENMMRYLQEEIKPEPSFTKVDDINQPNLSTDESEIATVAERYQKESEGVVQVDLDARLIFEDGQIRTVEKRDDGYGVFAPTTDEQFQDENFTQEKTPQKTLQKRTNPLKQAGFSDALILALLTGLLMGLAILNIYIKIS